MPQPQPEREESSPSQGDGNESECVPRKYSILMSRHFHPHRTLYEMAFLPPDVDIEMYGGEWDAVRRDEAEEEWEKIHRAEVDEEEPEY